MKTPSTILFGLILTCAAVRAEAPTYVVHEWGTFTSVQGSDGVQMVWNPFESSELPKFVFKLANPLGNGVNPVFFTKAGVASRQRMETPVIYFYAKQAQTVNVDVKFPSGVITEWYPQVANSKAQAIMMPNLTTQWKNVEILPGDGAAEAGKFPKDATGSHYYAARETKASALRVKTADGTEQSEKFLFYRGIANFQAPLRVAHYGDQIDGLRLANEGPQPLGPLFIYSVRGDRAMLMRQDGMEAGKTASPELKFTENARPLAEVQQQLRTALRESLTQAGLYGEEAAAMVKTWDDSWLGEQGTRVLYLLPQTWTDGILPLSLSPAPAEVKRVFVGRAELISPQQEWVMLKEIVRHASGNAAEQKIAVETVSKLNLGRFTNAALEKAMAGGPRSFEFYQAVTNLQQALKPKAPEPVAPAATASWSTPATR